MAAVRSENTKPELLVRRIVHKMGYRFRLHRKDLPGTPDLTFPKRRKVIFVHGCFWHRHGCKRCSELPKSNESFWRSKLERNRQRDSEQTKALRQHLWDSLVIWECELGNEADIRKKITRFLESCGEAPRNSSTQL